MTKEQLIKESKDNTLKIVRLEFEVIDLKEQLELKKSEEELAEIILQERTIKNELRNIILLMHRSAIQDTINND